MHMMNRCLGLSLLTTLAVLPACGDDDVVGTGEGAESPAQDATTGSTTGVNPSLTTTTGTPDMTTGLDTSSTTGPDLTTTTDVTGPTTTLTDSSESGGTTTGGETTDGSTSSSGGSSTDEGTDSSDTTGIDPNESLDELVEVICDWGYNCCDDGELDYILGPYVDSADVCSERLLELITKSDDNSVGPDEQKLRFLGDRHRELPFTLAYRLRLDRSEAIPEGVAACAQAWREEGCREPAPEFAESCDEDPVSRVCQLDALFVGKVEQGGSCNWELIGPHSDIECVSGTTCEAINDQSVEDSASYRCVYKGVEGSNCTVPNHHDDTLQTGRGNGSCEWGLYCDAGTCTSRPGVGEACEYSDPEFPRVDRMAIPCAHDLYCDPATQLCVDECSDGYGCGPRTRAGTVVTRGRGVTDDRLVQYPTEGFKSPNDGDDRCGSGLSCMPYRSNPSGSNDVEKPGDVGYYFGKGTDRYGTSFECRPPHDAPGSDALCDTEADCARDLFCRKKYTARRDVSHDPHNHDDGMGLFAEVGRCEPKLEAGEQCFGPDDFDDFDPRADRLENLLEQADARCPQNYFCHLDAPFDEGGLTSGVCQLKLDNNAYCHRHEECNQGLCLATDQGADTAGLASARKRCIDDGVMIEREALCAPRAGLGSNVPFPIIPRMATGASDAPGHDMLNVDESGALVAQGPDVEMPDFPELWQGPAYPRVDPRTGAIGFRSNLIRVGFDSHPGPTNLVTDTTPAISDPTSRLVNTGRTINGAAHLWFWGAPSDSPEIPHFVEGPGSPDNRPHIFANLGMDISGGEYRRHAWMQGLAMNLRRDFAQWQRASGRSIGYDPSGEGAFGSLAQETTRSDFRHLASHCDTAADPTLVCMRHAADETNNSPFKCLPGGTEGDACDSDLGTFGDGRDSCAPGYECYFNKCRAHVASGGACAVDDTGDDNSQRVIRCDWRHRAPVYSMIDCPIEGVAMDDGEGVECRRVDGVGPWYLIDNFDGSFVQYVVEYDNGCEEVHNVEMCRLISEEAHDAAYCDGADSGSNRSANN